MPKNVATLMTQWEQLLQHPKEFGERMESQDPRRYNHPKHMGLQHVYSPAVALHTNIYTLTSPVCSHLRAKQTSPVQ